MKCVCGSIVRIDENTFAMINGKVVITCKNCNRAYLESDFSEIEIEKSYWKSLPIKYFKGGKKL